MPCVIMQLDYSLADWDGLCDHLRDVPWKDIFKLSASATLMNFVSGFRLELMYIFLTENIKSSHTHVHGFQPLALLPQFIEITWQNLALATFGKLLIVFSTKVHLLQLLYSMAQSCCVLHLINQNCLLKTFLRTLILITWESLYLFFSSRTNLKLYISITPKMVKRS